MNGKRKALIYLVVVVALCVVALSSPAAWATPGESRASFTVPSPTPVESLPPTPGPGGPDPAPTAAPTAVPPATGQPFPTPPSTPVTATASVLDLRLVAVPAFAWPGATVQFTLTLTNRGTASLRQVTLENLLPAGLVSAGASSGATWQGRTLRATRSVVPPGGRFVVPFAATVDAGVPAGAALVSEATARAAGGLSATARAVVSLPPAELPATGARSTGCASTLP